MINYGQYTMMHFTLLFTVLWLWSNISLYNIGRIVCVWLCMKHKVYCSDICKAFLINRTGKRLMLSWVMLGLDLARTTKTRRVALDSGRHACFTFSLAHITTDVLVLITMKRHHWNFTCFSSLKFEWSYDHKLWSLVWF